MDYERLDRHSRQLAEQLADASKQRRTAAGAANAAIGAATTTKDDHSTSSAASKKSSGEIRDAMHNMEVKLVASKGELKKMEKENQRLKSSMAVRDTIVPFQSCSTNAEGMGLPRSRKSE